MHTDNMIYICAPPQHVFELAAAIEDWPRLLPHYRYVRKVAECGSSDVACGPVYAMQALRTGYPCSWTSIQQVDREGRRVLYHHVAGVTTGMDVTWHVDQEGNFTRVSIVHDLEPRWWWLKPAPLSWLVGREFVMHIAQNTLRGVKRAAETTLQEGREQA